ncbi:MAG: M48 family metallopeptidase [Myxococcaceae bacterium]
MTRSAFVVSIAAAATLVTAGCSTAQRAKTETAIAEVLISDEQEAQLGEQVHEELKRQNVKLSNDPVVTGYVEKVANRLLPIADKDRKQPWHVHVVDDVKTVNAFATPGGHIYVYTGLLAASRSEAEVAGVLGHELGHVVGRHTARQLVQLYGLETVAGIALGQNPSQLAQIAAGIAGQGALLAHSRANEDEADEYGARYASAAGYDPRGLVGFLEVVMAGQGKTPRALTWLSTHPATPDRIRHVEEYIAEQGLTGTDVGADRLAPIKQHLGTPVSRR